MTPTAVGVLGMAAMLLLMFARMPIGLAMALVGAIGIALLNSPAAALNSLGSFPYSHAAVQAFAVIPLFVLMGNFAAVSGMGRDLYTAAYAWVGHRRGRSPSGRSRSRRVLGGHKRRGAVASRDRPEAL